MCRCILSKTSLKALPRKFYLASADELLNGVETYASARGYYTYIYNPGRAGWQTVALIGPEIGEEEPEPEPVVQEYLRQLGGTLRRPPAAVSIFPTVCAPTRFRLKTTLEKVDGATIEIEPITQIRQLLTAATWSISSCRISRTVTTSWSYRR